MYFVPELDVTLRPWTVDVFLWVTDPNGRWRLTILCCYRSSSVDNLSMWLLYLSSTWH